MNEEIKDQELREIVESWGKHCDAINKAIREINLINKWEPSCGYPYPGAK